MGIKVAKKNQTMMAEAQVAPFGLYRGECHSERLIQLPVTLPVVVYPFGIPGLAKTAVIASQCPGQVTVLFFQIVVQDGYPVADIGVQVHQVIGFITNAELPKGHNLHQTTGTGG